MRLYRWTVRTLIILAAALLSTNNAGHLEYYHGTDDMEHDPATGILEGAEPVRIDRGRDRACLLLHGWLSSPADFGDLPQALDDAGWDVRAPLLPGHGTRPQATEGVTAESLLNAARLHLRDLQRKHETVALAGFSMGGTIATILAAEQAPDALVLVAPFFGVTYKWYCVLPPRWWANLLSPFVRHVSRGHFAVRVNDPTRRDRIVTYPAFEIRFLTQLFTLRDRAARPTVLESLSLPVLLIYSAGDEVASPAESDEAYQRLPEGRKRRIVFWLSNHHLLNDYDRQQAIREITHFLEQAAPAQ